MSQKAISVNTNVAGASASLDTKELQGLLDQGWTVNQCTAACIGPILVVLDEPKPPGEQASQ